jgi:P pilus assembly chaperone PapD
LAAPSLGASASAQTGLQAEAAAQAPTDVGANLNISPKRLTLNRTQRSASVYIFNQGTAPATFDIGLVDRVMLPDGRIAPLDDALATAELKPIADRLASAKPLLLAAPRRVSLAPGKGQTIRVRLNPSEALSPAAEYRTHLTVTTVPPRESGYTAEEAAAMRPGELSFSIRSVFGVSIPIIVRFAEPQVAARLENARVHTASLSADGLSAPKPTPVATLDVVRSGANSLFGDLEVVAHHGRASEVIGAARGLGVYTEIDRRTVQVPLDRAPRKGERVEVRFSDSDAAPGKLLAAGDLVTP